MDMHIGGIPTNHYIHPNPQNGRVEVVKPMPPGTPDEVVKDFPDEASAWQWVEAEFNAGRMT